MRDVVARVYAEARRLHDTHGPQLGPADLGFKILYGPPHPGAPILFVGEQPGGLLKDEKPNERFGWPDICEFATEPWTLASTMRAMFGRPFLEGCVATNANVFRAPSRSDWRRIPKAVRAPLEAFGAGCLRSLIEALEPSRIVVIGFGPQSELGAPVLCSPAGRVLMRRCIVAGRPAEATLHLSGARLSTGDRQAIAARVRAPS